MAEAASPAPASVPAVSPAVEVVVAQDDSISEWFSKSFGSVIGFITRVFRMCFGESNPLAELGVFLLFIGILALIAWGIYLGQNELRVIYNRNKLVLIYNRFMKQVNFGYRSKQFYKRMNSAFEPEKNEPTSTNITNREPIEGRCNNLTMKQSGSLCVSTVEPEPIRWVIDSDSMPDYDKMNSATKKLLVGDGGKYIVHIPWGKYKNDGMHYYPNCSKATFADGSPADYLFSEDNKDYCTKKRIVRDKATQRTRDLKNWTL